MGERNWAWPIKTKANKVSTGGYAQPTVSEVGLHTKEEGKGDRTRPAEAVCAAQGELLDGELIWRRGEREEKMNLHT